MAITIQTTFTVEGAQAVTTATAQTTSAFKGIQDQLKQMETASGQTTAKMITGLKQLSQQGTVTATGQGALGKALLQTGQAAGATTAQLGKLKQQYLETEKASKSVIASHGSMLNSLKSLAAGFGVVFSVQGLIGFTKSIVEAGIANERLMLSLKGALGSAQAAGEAYAFVEGVANRLGIGLLTAGESFAKLTAATQGTVVQGQQTRDLFVAISEASRVMGLSTSEVGGVVTALTQIIGKNTVSMEELRQQLGERLPSALRLTAKEMGVTTSRFIEMVSKGEVLATDFIPAVTRAMQQMGREAPAAAQSVQAALERLGNAWFTLKVTIAQSGLLELVARIGEEMTRVINQTTNWINRTKRMAGELGVAPMVAEMQRITQSIQAQQEILADPNIFAPLAEHARTTMTALEAQRDALADQIRVKQQVVEQDEKVRQSADALAAQDIKNASAKEAEIAVLRKASQAWISLGDDIKEVETSLKALRSFDVESLKALQIDPFAADFEQQWNRAETFLLKKHKDLLDKRAGLDKGDAARATREAGESAVARAKAAEDVLTNQLKREEAMIEASANKRRQAIDEAVSAALTAQGPGAVEAIAAQRMHDLQAVATDVATELEKLRLDTLEKQEQARETTLKAEIAAAGKNLSAAAAAQEELKNLTAATEQERAEIVKKRADADQKTSKQSADEQIKNARDVNKIVKEIEEDRLKARIDLVDEQIALIEAQVHGEVLTTEEGTKQIQALYEKRFADTRLLYERQAQAQIDVVNQEVEATLVGTEARVQAEAIAVEQVKKIREGLATQLETVNLKQQTETQRFLNEQVQAYERFVDKVSSGLASIFEGLLDGTLNLLESFKKLFLRTLSQLIAEAATRAIIVPIITQVIGAVGSFAPGVAGAVSQAIGLAGAATGAGGGGGGGTDLLGTGGTALTGIGLTRQLTSLFGVESPLSQGFSFLTDTVTAAGQALVNWVNAVKFGTSVSVESAIETSAAMDAMIPGTTAAGPGTGAGAVTLGQIGGIAGGLAALGGGIYAALNASNNAAKAAYAASAAAGAFAAGASAAAAGILGASAATAIGTGWTGIGLIVAAVMAVIGVVLDKVIKPAGPSLAVGRPQGLNIGTVDGKLQVQGDLGSRIIKQEGVDPEVARGVQAQLEAGITNAVISIVDTINAIALDPAALVGPTQEALQTALNNIRTINSGSLKHMERDVTEQLRFANVAIIGGLLEPLNLAFDQLRDTTDVQKQIERLPGSVQGLLGIFKTMNTQLDEMANGENTDVIRQISSVRNQVENFGNRIAGTAAQTAESIVNGILEQFAQARKPGETGYGIAPGEMLGGTTPETLEASSQALKDFDFSLADQITQFATLMNKSLGALASLRSTQQALEGVGLPGGGVGAQIDRLTAATGQAAAEISTQIVTTALSDLSSSLDQVLIQPITVQATTVNSLFTDSLAALSALWTQWHNLADAGIDTTLMQEQFSKLVGGILDTTTKVLDNAFKKGSFSEFLNVLSSIPKAVTDLNPSFAKLQQIGAAFQQVVGPIAKAITELEDTMRTPAERIAFTSTRIADLQQAIADAGDSADQALPLYAQLAQAILDNANLQIQAIQEIAQAWHQAMDQVTQDIATLEQAVLPLGTQITMATTAFAQSIAAYDAAIAAGDTVGAIEALQDYEQGILTIGQLQIEQIQAVQQAWTAAMDQVSQSITGLEATVLSLDQQLALASQDVANSLADLSSALAAGNTVKAINAVQDYAAGIQAVGALQIQQIQANRQATIDAQQAVIDGTQDSIDAIQDQMKATQKWIDAAQKAIQAQQEQVSLLEQEVQAREATVATLKQQIESLKQLSERTGSLVRGTAPPPAALASIRANLAETQGRLAGVTGDEAIKELEKLVSLNEELKQLGEQTNRLDLVKEAMDNLIALQTELNARLAGAGEQLTIAEQQLQASQANLDAANAQLTIMQADLDAAHAMLEGQQEAVNALQDVLDVQREELDAIQRSTYWDEQIAAVNAGMLTQLYQVKEWLRAIQGATSWDEQIFQINLNMLAQLYNVANLLNAIQGGTTWEDQIKQIQLDTLNSMRQMELWLQALFLKAVAQAEAAGLSLATQAEMAFWLAKLSSYNLQLPVKTEVTNFYAAPKQHGGIVGYASGLYYAQGGMVPPKPSTAALDRVYDSLHVPHQRFAQGGMVPVIGEPLERVFTPPLSHAQAGALVAMNTAFPRFGGGGFTVPGSGSGDSVRMMVPSGSFILNRTASSAMGYQQGGTVQSGSSQPTVIINFSLNGATFKKDITLEDLKALLLTLERRSLKRGS